MNISYGNEWWWVHYIFHLAGESVQARVNAAQMPHRWQWCPPGSQQLSPPQEPPRSGQPKPVSKGTGGAPWAYLLWQVARWYLQHFLTFVMGAFSAQEAYDNDCNYDDKDGWHNGDDEVQVCQNHSYRRVRINFSSHVWEFPRRGNSTWNTRD